MVGNVVTSRRLKQTLMAIVVAGAGLVALSASAQPGGNGNGKGGGQPNVNSVAIFEYEFGPGCATFAVTSSVNEAANIKDISNIVLACGPDDDGNTTWDKWEFDSSPYGFGTPLPGGLEPSEGSGCIGAITTAYVKAGSKRSRKGIPGVDPKEFNGWVGQPIDCDAPTAGGDDTGGDNGDGTDGDNGGDPPVDTTG